jgi:urease accessory protein
VDSRVEIVADVTDQGRTVLSRLKARGQLAVRCTAPGTVHLVGTAAGPLGGDVVEVSVLVRSGASLVVAGVAASLALPGRSGGWAESSLDLTVEDGARLVHALPPLVVCRRAQLRTTIRLALVGSAAADITEQVVFGRHGEAGGDWVGRITADHNHRPVLRTTQRSAVLRAGLYGSGEVRALVSRLCLGPGPHQARSTSGNAVACPLGAGGVLVTSIGPDLSSALADSSFLGDHVVPAPSGGARTT